MRLLFLLIGLTFSFAASGQSKILHSDDAVRIAEAYSLSERVGDEIWDGWSETPFPILLLTPEKDFLIGHPYPSDDFTLEGVDEILGKPVYSRPRTEGWPSGMLATFPAVGGLSTVVVGQAEATGLNSTRWVLTLLHEHFHQLQNGWEGYFPGVEALDLANGDQTGMWMLNYPFPYDDLKLAAIFEELRDEIESELTRPSSAADLREILARIKSAIPEQDFRYFTFQLWQEGVSRYTEQIVAQFAVASHTPTPAFSRLLNLRSSNDVSPYGAGLDDLLQTRSTEMNSMNLANQQRVVFYALGASLAMVLDELNPSWRSYYFTQPFDLVSILSELD